MRRADRPSYNTAQLNRIATMAAKAAVQETFAAIGVDTSTPGAVIQAQEMFSGLRSLQRDWQVFRNRLIIGAAAMFCSVVYVVAMHFLQKPQPPL